MKRQRREINLFSGFLVAMVVLMYSASSAFAEKTQTDEVTAILFCSNTTVISKAEDILDVDLTYWSMYKYQDSPIWHTIRMTGCIPWKSTVWLYYHYLPFDLIGLISFNENMVGYLELGGDDSGELVDYIMSSKIKKIFSIDQQCNLDPVDDIRSLLK